MTQDWITKVKEYCENYNIPLDYLADTLYEPKVVPMIRGKAFEFSVMIALQSLLSKNVWEVKKVPMNAQLGLHDTDVLVIHKPSGRKIRVECKLAKKGSSRLFPDGRKLISVKCMRSRTLGPSMVKSLAPRYGKSVKQLAVHNDQYLPNDFDIVITSIGNTFYRTNKQMGIFEWEPTEKEKQFLQSLSKDKIKNLKNFAFSKMFVSTSNNLVINRRTGIKCTRRKCSEKKKCGFIPNYPLIKFAPNTIEPNNDWFPLPKSLKVFEAFI